MSVTDVIKKTDIKEENWDKKAALSLSQCCVASLCCFVNCQLIEATGDGNN